MIVWHGTSLNRFRLMEQAGFTSTHHQLYVGDTLACADHYAAQKAAQDGCEATVIALDFKELWNLSEQRLIHRREGPPIIDFSHSPKGSLHPDYHYGNERQKGQWLFIGDWSNALKGAWLREPGVRFLESLTQAAAEPPTPAP